MIASSTHCAVILSREDGEGSHAGRTVSVVPTIHFRSEDETTTARQCGDRGVSLGLVLNGRDLSPSSRLRMTSFYEAVSQMI